MNKLVVLAALSAFAAAAQSRGPVIPNYQDPSKQVAAPAPAPAAKQDDVDLVGPTAAQQARAKAAADAKAKADADAKAAAEKKARDEAEAKARAEAQAKAKAEAETKARAEAEAKARAEAEVKARAEADAKARAEADAKAKAQADAEAARKRSIEEAQARANAATEAAKQKALDAVLAQRRAAEEARAAARAAAEAKKAAREQLQAAAREEARARKAEQEARAQARALQAARKREETACGKGKKAQACLQAVAAKYDAPLPLPSLAAAPEPLAIAPLVASVPGAAAAAAPAAAPEARAVAMPGSPTPPPPAKPLETLAAGDRRVLLPPTASAPAPAPAPAAAPAVAQAAQPAPVRVASAVSPAPAPAAAPAPAPRPVAAAVVAVPRDEQQRRPRSAEVVNDLQIGPQSLILDHLQARGDIVPGGIQLEFGYRLAIDDATAPHHLFSAGVSSARCQSDACGLRWFLRGGLGPRNSSNFGVERRVNGVNVAQTDSLGWAANVLQLGLGYSGASLFALADVQAEGLAEDYAQNVKSTNPPQVHGSLQQWRLRGTAGLQRGSFTGQVRIAGYAYGGDPVANFKNVPVRGALIEDDLPGLAGALQSFSARAEATFQLRESTDLSASYGFIAYSGPVWSNANIFAASVGQKLGRFRLALGLVYELEQDAQGNGYPTMFGTGSLGASF